MNRPRDEHMVKTIKRLATTIKKKTASKSPKKKKVPTNSPLKVSPDITEEPSSGIVVKYADDSLVDIDLLKNYEITTGMTVAFESMVFRIVKNPPTITAIQIFPKSCVIVNYPIVPTVTTGEYIHII